MSFTDALNDLKKVDLSELDVNNLGSWPAAVKAIASAFLFLAVLGLGYYLQL